MTCGRVTLFPHHLNLICVASLLCGGAAGCSKSVESATGPKAVPKPIQARVFVVSEQSWPREVATQGNLIADETTIVGTKVAGRIDTVAVDLGDVVKAGMVLASLDRREHEERLRQAEAELTQVRAAIGLDADDDVSKLDPNAAPNVAEQKALWDQARADRERLNSLRGKQAATEAQYEAAVAAEQVARARHASALNTVEENIALVRVRGAQLELARQQFEDAVIRAPFDGRVQERFVSPGTYVQIGESVVTLIRDDPLRYRGTVPEIYASSLATGERVRLRVATGSEVPEVSISRISPGLDPLSRSLLFEASVPNPEHTIQAGQFAQGEVLLDQTRRALALPKSAVVEFAGTQKVWKVVKGEAVEQAIEIGEKRRDYVEILRGVEPGDQVLLQGSEGRPAKVEIQDVVTVGPMDAGIGLQNVSAPR